MIKHPVYPSLWRAANSENVDKPYLLEGKPIFQQCYICGLSVSFAKDMGKWQTIGGGIIRHKTCDPLPYKGVKLQ